MGFGRTGFNLLPGIAVHKSVFLKEGYGFFKIIHIHPDDRHILVKNLRLGNVHMEAVGVFHPDSRVIKIIVYGALAVRLFKAKFLKQFGGRSRVGETMSGLKLVIFMDQISFQFLILFAVL